MNKGASGGLLVGLALLAFTWVCWSGRWRWWVQTPPGFARSSVITIAPGLGLACVCFALYSVLPSGPGFIVGVIGFLAMLAGAVLVFWEPEWYGPRWFREVNRAFAAGTRADLTWMENDKPKYGETSVDATERHVYSKRPVPPSDRVRLLHEPLSKLVHLNETSGAFIYFPQAPVFAVGGKKVSVPVNEIIAAESLTGASVLAAGTEVNGSIDPSAGKVPRVRIDTAEGPWLFEARKAGKIAREIEARYLNPETMPYGLPPARRGRRTTDTPDGAGGKA